MNFSASNDFPAVEVLAELANASNRNAISLSLARSGERGLVNCLTPSPYPSSWSGGGNNREGYYVEAFLKNGRSNIMELP